MTGAGARSETAGSSPPVLRVRHLGVRLPGGRRRHGHRADAVLVHDVDLTVHAGEVVAVVGENGAGKSTTLAALAGLLPAAAQLRGRAWLHPVDPGAPPVDLLDLPDSARARLRGREVALLPQGPVSHLTPVRTVGAQLREAARLHARGRRDRDRLVQQAVERAGAGQELLDRYPHQLSGGQVQRLSNAAALLGRPRLVLADEPTTGLDPDRAAVAAAALRRLAAGGSGVVVVTHDLSLAEAVADTVVVLYAGRTVESGPAPRVLAGPRHPYTAGLLGARPRDGLRPVPGDPPPPTTQEHTGCPFAPRCALADDRCRSVVPVAAALSAPPSVTPAPATAFSPPGAAHVVACHHAAPRPAGAVVQARC